MGQWNSDYHNVTNTNIQHTTTHNTTQRNIHEDATNDDNNDINQTIKRRQAHTSGRVVEQGGVEYMDASGNCTGTTRVCATRTALTLLLCSPSFSSCVAALRLLPDRTQPHSSCLCGDLPSAHSLMTITRAVSSQQMRQTTKGEQERRKKERQHRRTTGKHTHATPTREE